MSMLTAHAQRLAEDGLEPHEIEAELIHQGNDATEVRQAVANLSHWVEVNRQSQAIARADSGSTSGDRALNVGLGALLLTLGLVGSIVGSKIFVGAILVGAIRLMRGLAA